MKGWKCSRCGRICTTNPEACPDCGHRVFDPVSVSELRARASGTQTPSTFEPELTVGTRPPPNFERGPDVAPDGSLEGVDPEPPQKKRGLFNRLRQFVGL